jgi:uncharacterized protein (DUF983 family)
MAEQGRLAEGSDTAGAHRPLFRAGHDNRCPDCGSAQWLVGRLVAECAACATPVPRAGSELQGAGTARGRKGWISRRAA